MLGTIEKIKELNDKVFLPGHKDEILDIVKVIFFQLSKLFEHAKKLENKILRENIYSVLKAEFSIVVNDFYSLYIKASVLFFIRDMFENIDKLKQTLVKTFPNILFKLNI